ncbi:MAG: hypothetical protein A2Y38_02835 [Spirochaetes bacterium GWB1_59_5]|nr:MAG: hypothetical protein A2Y38_02835 [Spirochaetes bacterium GWB1_59_5]
MPRTVADVKASLLEKLTRAAQAQPNNPRIAAVLEKLGAQDKVAITEGTEEFIRWALTTQAPMSPTEVEAFVTRTLGVPLSLPVKKRPGDRYRKGDQVEIIVAKHKDRGSDIGPYQLHNGKIGTVVETDGMDVLVAFKGEPAPVRFGNGLKPQGVGIYKYVEPQDVPGSAKIEMIYLADPTSKSSEDQKATVEVYLGRGRGVEKRSANYYTGYVVLATTSAEGQFYFRGYPQQRMRVDPKAEGGYMPRTFNPSKGKVLYLGLFGKQPANWEAELAKLDEALATEK